MRLIASTLALSLILTAPGYAPYAAAANVVRPGAVSGAAGLPGVAPQIAPLPAGVSPVSGLPALDVPAPLPSLPAALPVSEAAGPAALAVSAAEALVPGAIPSLQAPSAAPGASALPLPSRDAATDPEQSRAAGLSALAAAQELGGLGSLAGPKFDGGARLKASDEAAPVPGVAATPAPSSLAPEALWDPAKASETPVPNGHWRPKSSRIGVGAVQYVWWNSFYVVMKLLDRAFSFGRVYKISWDRWPTPIALIFLIAKLRYVRSNTLTDPYDYKTNDNMPPTPEPEAARKGYLPDAKWALDRENPQMGTPNTRFGSDLPPMKVKPDPENARPTAEEAAKLRLRKIDPVTNREIVQPAGILNVKAAGWIQFQFHNFGGNTKRDPIDQDPHRLPRDPKAGWPNNEAVVDRTSKDHTRVTDDGRPTPLNEKVQAWVQGQLYGSSAEELAALRSFKDGKMRLDENGNLPEDPKKPGIDQTGFNNNYNPILSYLHWLFVMEHNAIADHYRYFHPDWDDETLFQMARKVNVAQIARIHTIQWTEDLLQHPTLQTGMHADWYGLIGQKLKMWLMRQIYRRPWVGRALKRLTDNDTIFGMPGSRWEHHDGPFQVPKHFRMVYRLHEMILGEYEILDPKTDRTLSRIDLLNFVHGNTRPIVEQFGYEALAYSFQKKSAGHLKLHNMTNKLAIPAFRNQQNGQPTNLAELDLLRERTDGTGTFNEFMEAVGEAPVTSFLELTGGDAELARELEVMYEGDVNAVDAGIGILAYPKPAGFALSFPQFYQFVFNAPRRVKSNRHLTELFDYANYLEGMDWIEHGGGIFGAERRHVPALIPHMEGVLRSFMPWPDVEKFPKRMLLKAYDDAAGVFKADLRTFALATAAAAAALWTGVAAPWMVAAALGALAYVPLHLAIKRMLALFFMRNVWEKVYTDRRASMFPALEKGSRWIERAAVYGKVAAVAVVGVGATLAFLAWGTSPLAAILLALTALSGVSTYRGSNAFAADSRILKIALRTRMLDGQPKTDETAVEKDVDAAAFEDLFRRYAPGRTYMTAYDFARMREDLSWRAASPGRGLESLADEGETDRLLKTRADMVVEEDRALVPAISKDELLRVSRDVAMADPMTLPEGGWKGTTAGLKGRDVMSLLIKKDERSDAYYATLSQYTRVNVPSPERLQVTSWVPRMHVYRVERVAGGRYAMRPLRVSKDGEIEPDPDARPDVLVMKESGSLAGATLTRHDKDGNAVETVAFTGGSGSTWENFVPAKYFWSHDPTGGDYFHKDYNAVLGEDKVIEFLPEPVKENPGFLKRAWVRFLRWLLGKGDVPASTRGIRGKFELVEKAPGLYVLKPKGSGQTGGEKLAPLIGVFIDIVNWKPVFKTNELMLINPADPTDVGFFYQRHI